MNSVRQEYIIDGTSVHRRALYTHIHILGQISISNPSKSMLLGGGKKPENLEETYRENMGNST